MKFKDSAWIVIALLTLITAVVWLAVTVQSTLNKSTVPTDLERISKPLNPALDAKVFDSLKQRSDE